MDNPFAHLVGLWHAKIKSATEHKKRCFQDAADEMMTYYNGSASDVWDLLRGAHSERMEGPLGSSIPNPTFRMNVNKVAEFVQIFGPVMYNRNPTRTATPRDYPSINPGLLAMTGDPQSASMWQQRQLQEKATRDVNGIRAALIESVLNYSPVECGLFDHSRRAIDEALIKGRGVVWTELYQPPGAQFKIVGSFYDSVDHLFVDPDAENLKDARWIARRRITPVWETESRFGLEPGTLKANLESLESGSAAAADRDGEYKRLTGDTNDMIVWWEVYSKMGFGQLLKGAKDGTVYDELLSEFGPFKYLALTDGYEYFLNVPETLVERPLDEQTKLAIRTATDWPVPFWGDSDRWPFTELDFHLVPRSPWPQSHLKPAIGELRAIDWIVSFCVSKVRTTCRDFIAVAKELGTEITNIVESGRDLAILPIDPVMGKSISEAIQFLQHPHINSDVFTILDMLMGLFDKRVGLTELAYGMSARQMRSASEAKIKADALSVRPDAMAQTVEDWASEIARKEAIAAKYLLSGQDVAPIVGQFNAPIWDWLVKQASLESVCREFDYRVENGSARKPNRERDVSLIDESAQVVLPQLVGWAQATGQVEPVNEWLKLWNKSRGLPEDTFVLTPPPPPMMAGPPPGGPPSAGGPPRPAAA